MNLNQLISQKLWEECKFGDVCFFREGEREKALSHFYAHSCHDHENDNKKVNKSVCKGN